MGVSDADAKRRVFLTGGAGREVQGWRQASELLGKGQLGREEPFDSEAAHETVLLCYSSGTTSRSKGVEVSDNGRLIIIRLMYSAHIVDSLQRCERTLYRGKEFPLSASQRSGRTQCFALCE